jgi:hypothetical protein
MLKNKIREKINLKKIAKVKKTTIKRIKIKFARKENLRRINCKKKRKKFKKLFKIKKI